MFLLDRKSSSDCTLRKGCAETQAGLGLLLTAQESTDPNCAQPHSKGYCKNTPTPDLPSHGGSSLPVWSSPLLTFSLPHPLPALLPGLLLFLFSPLPLPPSKQPFGSTVNKCRSIFTGHPRLHSPFQTAHPSHRTSNCFPSHLTRTYTESQFCCPVKIEAKTGERHKCGQTIEQAPWTACSKAHRVRLPSLAFHPQLGSLSSSTRKR